MQKSTFISIAISIVFIGLIFYLVSNKPDPSYTLDTIKFQNIEIKDGVQYITVIARAGYNPRFSQIEGGLPTKLVVKTNNSYDCSIALSIPSIGFQKILETTGEEVIDLGVVKSGQKIRGVCSMGMYSFEVEAL